MNVAIGYCDCPDNHYRQTECKHLQRARFALGVEGYDISAWIDRDAIDEALAQRLDEREEVA